MSKNNKYHCEFWVGETQRLTGISRTVRSTLPDQDDFDNVIHVVEAKWRDVVVGCWSEPWVKKPTEILDGRDDHLDYQMFSRLPLLGRRLRCRNNKTRQCSYDVDCPRKMSKVWSREMRDIFFKIRLLFPMLFYYFQTWKEHVWDVELDAQICCSGYMCGCAGATNWLKHS